MNFIHIRPSRCDIIIPIRPYTEVKVRIIQYSLESSKTKSYKPGYACSKSKYKLLANVQGWQWCDLTPPTLQLHAVPGLTHSLQPRGATFYYISTAGLCMHCSPSGVAFSTHTHYLDNSCYLCRCKETNSNSAGSRNEYIESLKATAPY